MCQWEDEERRVREIEVAFCIIGIVLLASAIISCLMLHDRIMIWIGLLVAGEMFAWIGAIPILSKFFCQ